MSVSGGIRTQKIDLTQDMMRTKDFQVFQRLSLQDGDKQEDQEGTNLSKKPPYFSSTEDFLQSLDPFEQNGPAGANKSGGEVVLEYECDPEQVEIIFRTLAEESPDRLNRQEFSNACQALGSGCTLGQIREVFMEIDKDNKGYISLNDFRDFLRPEPEDDLVKVKRKLQRDIAELSTDEEPSESSGDSGGDNFWGNTDVAALQDREESGVLTVRSGHSSTKNEKNFGPRYLVKFEENLIKDYLIPGPDDKNAFVKIINTTSSLAKLVKSGSKVVQVESYNVLGLSFDDILKMLDCDPPFSILFRHPDSVPKNKRPPMFDVMDDEKERQKVMSYSLVGSPTLENCSPARMKWLKKDLPSHHFWEYPFLILGDLIVALVYWTPVVLLVTAVAFSFGIFICYYKLLKVIWDPELRSWSTLKKRHFTGCFERLGNYLDRMREEKQMEEVAAKEGPGEKVALIRTFLKYACVRCGDWTNDEVINYLGLLLTREWVNEFKRLHIDGKVIGRYQTEKELAMIDPDWNGRQSLKRREEIAAKIAEQFQCTRAAKIMKSFKAVFASLFLGPKLIFWMWTAWIRRTIEEDPIKLGTGPCRYIQNFSFHAPLPDHADCWPKLRHSPRRTTWRIRVFLTIENEEYSFLSYCIAMTVMLLIFVSTLAYIGETIPEYEDNVLWEPIEWVVTICFTLEYGIRILMCRDMWGYFIDFMNMIDFLAVIPFWIEQLSMHLSNDSKSSSGSLFRVIRVIRLARVVRLLKSKQFSDYLDIFKRTLQMSADSFGLLFTIIFMETIIFASLIYVTELGVLNEETGQYIRSDGHPTDFTSIPEAAYWCVVTMTTVGYGDQYPVTVAGQIIGCFTMFTGLFVIALPVIIIGENFGHVFKNYKDVKKLEEKREKISESKAPQLLNEDALERYERGKRSVIELAIEVNQFLKMPNFLTYEHVNIFLSEEFDSRDRIVAVLRHKQGFAFLPKKIDRYRRFILYESYGKYLRKGNKQNGDGNRTAKIRRTS